MKRKASAICASVLISGTAFANNGDQMVGYSAISNAMGGAVVAMPQDVTTALSNPAGLSYLNMGNDKTRFDMNLSLLNPKRSMNGVDSDSNAYIMATGGFAFQSDLFGRDFTISVGAYPISGGGVDFPAEAFKLGNSNAAVVASRVSLRIGPAIAYKVSDKLSVGANLSLAVNQMSIKNFDMSTLPPKSMNFPNDVAYGGSFVLGTIYKINDRTNFGAAYTSRSYTEDLEWNMDDGKWRLSFQDPQTVSIGISHQMTEKLLLEADLKWLNYSDVRTTATLYGPTASKTKTLAYNWSDQNVLALGAKYRLSDGIVLLAGYNYGKSPIDEKDINNNAGVTAIVEHHLSAGVTAKVSKNSSLTFSLSHGLKNEMTASVGTPTKVSFETNLASMQFTYRH
ncbi:OmpP1/FadL family transporter [Sulfuricella sp.]|uniref:OmpP1/FadL family transporter n=1 Tax=Sulfuricella sp. TaxID=2099377 RepID=UPI002BBDA8A3|nr:outer membrane protein transport protein [Sulfuricella sp.]HUX62310.1 outer membrane protein transport protein [Sulfuricella sp.]